MSKTSTDVKRRYNEKVYSQILVQVPKDMAAAFKEACAANGTSQSAVLKATIEAYIKEYGEASAMEKYSVKEKIVKEGNSRVFRNWNEHCGVSEEDFLAGLKWLCEDPRPEGKLTRELGCKRSFFDQGESGLFRLTRKYYDDGRFAGFYDENGVSWGGTQDFSSISADDRI